MFLIIISRLLLLYYISLRHLSVLFYPQYSAVPKQWEPKRSKLCAFKRSMPWQKLLLLLFTQGSSVIWGLVSWLLRPQQSGDW